MVIISTGRGPRLANAIGVFAEHVRNYILELADSDNVFQSLEVGPAVSSKSRVLEQWSGPCL